MTRQIKCMPERVFVEVNVNCFMLKPGMEIGRFEDGNFIMKNNVPEFDRSNCFFVKDR